MNNNKPLPGIQILTNKRFFDERGFFFEIYNQMKTKRSLPLPIEFLQDNISQSKHGVIRGLHYQVEPYAQAKLVTVLYGKVLDVVVDLRKNSPTYGEQYSIELSEENGLQLFVPRGFAHGFSVLSDSATFYYKCDGFYNKEAERGIRFNDPSLNIDWQVPEKKQFVSEKDRQLPLLKNADFNFVYET